MITGTFDMLGITATRGMDRGPTRSRIRVAVTDSAERYGIRGIGPDGRRAALWEQPLTLYIDIPKQTPPWPSEYVYRLRGGAFVQDERHLCLDCGAAIYWLEAVGPSGIRGRWEAHFGGVKVKGSDGNWHAAVSGRFCAYRVSADSSRDRK